MGGAAMAGFIVVTGGLSATSAGINAHAEQEQIKQEVCQLAAQMKQYKQMMTQEVNIFAMAAAEEQNAADGIAMNISDLKDSIRRRHANFKQMYNMWVVVAVVILILLIFVFASKKLILHATTEPNQ